MGQKTGKTLDEKRLLSVLERMLLIRNFETRAESAYLQGKVGGFFHSYIGQEAIALAAVEAFGLNNWWVATYRCHALALLTGATPNEIMAELYGRATGNALGRGGSMHLYTERLMGGFAIVGGHLPIAAGAAFALKYKNNKDELAVCFLGDGAVAQGTLHETLNLCSLWDLPCVFIIENNQWGMGTAVQRALCMERLAEEIAPAYKIKGYTFDGMDFFGMYEGFSQIRKEVLETQRPVLIEVLTERFKGHSISDPGLYRSKEALQEAMKKDPILKLKEELHIDDKTFGEMDKKMRQVAVDAMQFAEESPWPDPTLLEEDVYA